MCYQKLIQQIGKDKYLNKCFRVDLQTDAKPPKNEVVNTIFWKLPFI